MTDAEMERQRKLLHEAFTAGWQAALAVKVTNPGVLAIIESCFELWLEEEVDERGVLGLPFRRRYDLPRPRAAHARPRSQPSERPRARRTPVRAERLAPAEPPPTPVESTPSILRELPRQREHSDPEREVETSGTGL